MTSAYSGVARSHMPSGTVFSAVLPTLRRSGQVAKPSFGRARTQRAVGSGTDQSFFERSGHVKRICFPFESEYEVMMNDLPTSCEPAA
jgi:hypothetical protein